MSATKPIHWLKVMRFGALGLILISLLLMVRQLPMNRLVELLTAQVDALGFWGSVVFAAVYVIAAVLFVPGSALTLAAGAVFGLFLGTIVVSVASTTAASAAFLIGRYLARNTVHQWAARNPRFGAIDRAIGQGGWKVIALLRLSPAVPFSLGNYLFGLTAIRFWPYVITSWLAMLPGTFLYVYLGYVGRAGLTAAAGGSSRSPAQWGFLVIGLVATVVVTVYVTRLARKAVKENTAMSEEHREPETPNQPVVAPRKKILSTAILTIIALTLAGCTVMTYLDENLVQRLFPSPPEITEEENQLEGTQEKNPPDATQEESQTNSTQEETNVAIPAAPSFDHSAFDALLKKHVRAGGRVDYKKLKLDAAALDAYITTLATAPFDELGRDGQLALLINGYNAFTLRLILDYYPVKSIKNISYFRRWRASRWNVAGKTYSLNDIEHEEIRPKFKEPRIHFALVCAAIGCPPLRNEAYIPERLEEQLEDQAVYVHTHDRWFQYDEKSNELKLTKLYDWYDDDFEQAAGSVEQFAARYSPALQTALDADRDPSVDLLDYDWALNDLEAR